jgi:hypothetical protein
LRLGARLGVEEFHAIFARGQCAVEAKQFWGCPLHEVDFQKRASGAALIKQTTNEHQKKLRATVQINASCRA